MSTKKRAFAKLLVFLEFGGVVYKLSRDIAGALGSALALRFPTKLLSSGADLAYFPIMALIVTVRTKFVGNVWEFASGIAF